MDYPLCWYWWTGSISDRWKISLPPTPSNIILLVQPFSSTWLFAVCHKTWAQLSFQDLHLWVRFDCSWPTDWKLFRKKIIENGTSRQIMESHSIVSWGKWAFIWLMPHEIQIFCEWTTKVWKLWFSGLESAAIFAVSIYTLFLMFCALNVRSKKANGPIALTYIYIV